MISPWSDQEGNKLRRMLGTRAISTTSRRELSSSIFISLQGKTPKEIQAILTETLACFLPGQAKDLSAPLHYHQAHTQRHIQLLIAPICCPCAKNPFSPIYEIQFYFRPASNFLFDYYILFLTVRDASFFSPHLSSLRMDK